LKQKLKRDFGVKKESKNENKLFSKQAWEITGFFYHRSPPALDVRRKKRDNFSDKA